MKKLLMMVILLGISLGFSVKAQAATGFKLEKASIDTTWSETYGVWNTGYQLNSGADWEWLKLGVTGSFDNPLTDDASSNLKLAVDFPKLADRLGVDLQYSWDARYQMLNTGVSYTRKFGEHWQASGEYANEKKEGITTDSSLYSHQINQGSISLGVEYEPWKYQFKYLGQINDHLKKPDDNFTQTDLQQEISWRPRKDLRLQLYYQEMERNFTVDYPSNFWEAKYGFRGDWKAGELWQWNWDYYWYSREEDNETQERQSLSLELESLFDKNNKLISQFSASDCNTDYDEEYQASIPDDDPRVDLPPSVPTWKAAVKFEHKFVGYSLEVGYCYTEEHDPSQTAAQLRDGISGSFRWEFQKMNLTLKAAPTGDFQHTKQFYEIKLVYEF